MFMIEIISFLQICREFLEKSTLSPTGKEAKNRLPTIFHATL